MDQIFFYLKKTISKIQKNICSNNNLPIKLLIIVGGTMTSGTTGQKCELSGVYYCSKHPSNTIPLAIGNTFPPCSWGGGHSAVWILKYPA